MKKCFLFFSVILLAINSACPQNNDDSQVRQMDNAVKSLARDVHRKLQDEKAGKITVGQFVYRGSVSSLGIYWNNQLSEELSNSSNRSYDIMSAGQTGAEWTVSGEIIEVVDVIRVYTRVMRLSDRTIGASYHSDLERNTALNRMLSTGGGSESRGSGSGYPDEWEPDSWDNPVPYEIGENDSAPLMNRNLHDGDDEDFFLLIPDIDGRLTAETTGDIDTYMEFYNYDTRDLLTEDDDGGSRSNARIRYTVQAGNRYLAKVRGYSSSVTGNYGFRAYIAAPREGSSSMENPIPYAIGKDENATLLNRTLYDDSDGEFFLLVPESDGRLTIETTGDLDTYMTLYNADTKADLAEDDDSGSGLNARIRYTVQAGRRYIAKIRGYDRDTGNYGFRAYLSEAVTLARDEYEPDDDPSQAKTITIGTPQQHTFHTADDVDWVKFQITRPGRYIIRARGVNSNRLDTYIELFDVNLNSIAEDDDGGSDRDSRLSLHLENGLYYLKVWCLDDEPNQPYTISVIAD